MKFGFATLSAMSLVVATVFTGHSAKAAAEVVAMKSGETIERGEVYFISTANCRSLVKGPLSVEILEGPPEVTASIREQQVVPRKYNCAKPVPGGVLLLTAAKDIKDRIQAKLILRVKYPTVDGERQTSHDIDLTIVP